MNESTINLVAELYGIGMLEQADGGQGWVLHPYAIEILDSLSEEEEGEAIIDVPGLLIQASTRSAGEAIGHLDAEKYAAHLAVERGEDVDSIDDAFIDEAKAWAASKAEDAGRPSIRWA